jgi:hypothetical protein
MLEGSNSVLVEVVCNNVLHLTGFPRFIVRFLLVNSLFHLSFVLFICTGIPQARPMELQNTCFNLSRIRLVEVLYSTNTILYAVRCPRSTVK